MRTDTKDILDELYALEPDLRAKESEIKKIIEKMLASKPKVEMNEAFRSELKAKILAEIHARTTKPAWVSWTFPFAGGVLACALLGAFVWQSHVATPAPFATQISFRPTVNEVSKESLGKIVLANNRPQSGGGGGMGGNMAMANNTIAPAVSQELDSTTNPVVDAPLGTEEAISSKRMASDMMIYPPVDMPIYNYVYSGELKLPEGEQTVYRKNPIPFNWRETTNVINSFNIEGINLGKFRNLGVSNINFVEDRDFGYMISVDFMSGTISMYQNWLRWPQIKCDQNGCEQPKQLTENDIPSNEKMITVADNFLKEYGIDTTGYGAPVVDTSWKIWYARSVADGQQGYIPDMYTVTYPLIIDGQEIYEEGGAPRGLTLSYDIRNNRISNFYGLEKQNLDKAKYAPITDKTLIDKMVKNGGRYIYDTPISPATTEGRKVVDIALGEPKMNYIHIYGEWKDGRSEEYYVPAYVFPIENPPKDTYYMPASIIVPLVEDFVQKMNYQVMDPLIYSTKPASEPAVQAAE